MRKQVVFGVGFVAAVAIGVAALLLGGPAAMTGAGFSVALLGAGSFLL